MLNLSIWNSNVWTWNPWKYQIGTNLVLIEYYPITGALKIVSWCVLCVGSIRELHTKRLLESSSTRNFLVETLLEVLAGHQQYANFRHFQWWGNFVSLSWDNVRLDHFEPLNGQLCTAHGIQFGAQFVWSTLVCSTINCHSGRCPVDKVLFWGSFVALCGALWRFVMLWSQVRMSKLSNRQPWIASLDNPELRHALILCHSTNRIDHWQALISLWVLMDSPTKPPDQLLDHQTDYGQTNFVERNCLCFHG